MVRQLNPRLLLQRLLLFCLLVLVATGDNHAQTPAVRVSEPNARITTAQLQKLRPAVMPDLKELLTQMNGEAPMPEELDQEFEACTFTALQLGKLGPAVLVQDLNFAGKSNLALINIYRPQNGEYKQLASGKGFVELLDGPAEIPDILYGWTLGVCHAMYYRLRYTAGTYTEDACNQEEEPASGGDTCGIEPCETSGGKLPTFLSPWESDLVQRSRGHYVVGPALTLNEIENAARVESRP